MLSFISRRRWLLLGLISVLFCLLASPFFLVFSTRQENIIYLDRQDTLEQVLQQSKAANWATKAAFRVLAQLTGYGHPVRAGRYDIGSGQSTLTVFRHLRNGHQAPVRLTIPVLRTNADLATFLGNNLRPDAKEFLQQLNDSAAMARWGKTPATAVCLFIPNTYEIYWTSSVDEVMKRMQRESRLFWTEQRQAQAKSQQLTPDEVLTIASIVEQETAYNPEKPRVAGMYLNRLRSRMPLQADPTIKFALQDFTLKRILQKHLSVKSPYNTYRNAGLPPGPICIPSVSSIESVLRAERHPYIYMCAKEDFSGSHNFAVTYTEHQANAQKYADALDKAGIK